MLGRLLHVAARLLERVLAVEHAGAGHLAQRGHVLGGEVGHGQATSTGSWRRALHRGAGRGLRATRPTLLGREPSGRHLAPVLGDEAALDHGVGHDPAHERARADGVVVAGDHVVDDVGVAVGVDHRHHGQAELAGLGDGDVLLLGVDHEHGVGQAVEVGDAAQVPAQLLELAGVLERLALGHALEVAGGLHGPELLHALDPARDGGEVGEHAAQPALVDVGHAAGLGVLGHRTLGLLLGPDEQDGAAVGHQVADVGVGGLDAAEGLAQVDEVDPVALAKNEALHLRVPPARLVAEVDSGLQQLSHGNDGHRYVPPVGCSPGAAPPDGRRPWNAPGACWSVVPPTALVGRTTLAAQRSHGSGPGVGAPRTRERRRSLLTWV